MGPDCVEHGEQGLRGHLGRAAARRRQHVHPRRLGQRGDQRVGGDPAAQPGELRPAQPLGPFGAEQQVDSAAPPVGVDEHHVRRGGQRDGSGERARTGSPTTAADGDQPAALHGRPDGSDRPGQQPGLVVGQ
jgi:hypothetical protein